MSFSHILTQSIQVSLAAVSGQKTYTAASRVSLSEAAPDSATTVMAAAIDVSALKSFFLLSDQDVNIGTNDAYGGSPDATIQLKAGVPYVWNTDSYDTFLLVAADIVTLHVTNASGSSATIQMEALIDPTP